MKKMKKLTVFIAFILIFSALGGVVSAEVAIAPSGVYGEETLLNLTPETQHAAFVNNDGILTEKEQIAQSKYEFMSLSASERSNIVSAQRASVGTVTRASYDVYRIALLHFRQENGYYCGPATLKQTINYLSSGANNPTQSALAQAIGTTTAGSSSTRMAQWLDSQGYPYYSVSVSTMTLDDISEYVYTDIMYYDNPLFGGISTTSSNWLYPTGGHLLNISGIQYNNSVSSDIEIEFTDPYITYVSSSYPNGKYFRPIASYKNVMTSFWW